MPHVARFPGEIWRPPAGPRLNRVMNWISARFRPFAFHWILPVLFSLSWSGPVLGLESPSAHSHETAVASGAPPPRNEQLPPLPPALAKPPVPPSAPHGAPAGPQRSHGPRPDREGPAKDEPEVDTHGDSLSESGSDFLASSNLVTHGETKRSPRIEEGQQLLDQARRQFREGHITQAHNNLVALVEGNAPDEIKRPALIDLAILAQEGNQLSRAQQIFSQFVRSYPQDPRAPEVALRQGLLYRQMGAPAMALSKFYAVMTMALTLKSGNVSNYQRLVLQAQTEIAETHYRQGNHVEAVDFFDRLLRQEASDLNKAQIQFKLVASLEKLGRWDETIVQARKFLLHYPGRAEEPEARFLLVNALRQAARRHEALQEAVVLLRTQRLSANQDPRQWAYWQHRMGNQIGNQLYQEGDFPGALEIYSTLVTADDSPAWQLPVWYQIGLIYERLRQPDRALEAYGKIGDLRKDLTSEAVPGLKTVSEMAQWRSEVLHWQSQVERFALTNAHAKAASSASR